MLRTVAAFLYLALPVFLFAQEWKSIEANDVALTDLRKSLDEMEIIQGDIRQEKAFAFLTEKLVSTGMFAFQKESRLRWEFNTPIEYIILINESSMRLKEEGVEKKYKGMNRILRQVKDIILGCIDGSIMDSPDYKTAFELSSDLVRIELEPKEKKLKEFIDGIQIQFALSGASLQHVALTDPSGDVTEIVFSNLEINGKVDEKLFADF